MGSLTIPGFAAAAAPLPHTDTQQGQGLQQRPPHVVLLASPGAGHLIPLAELARRLVERHGFAATLVTYTDLFDPRLLQCIPASVSTVALPAFHIDVPADGPVGEMLRELVRRSLPELRSLLRSMSMPPLAAFVPDFFCAAALPVAAEMGVPGYVFFPGSLSWIALMRHIVELHDDVALASAGEYRDVAEPLELPGPLSLRRADLPESCRDCSAPSYQRSMEWGRLFRDAGGLLVNIFSEMEPAALEAFEAAAKRGAFPPVFPVGPSIRSSPDKVADSKESPCLDWLDRQPTGSVVYVSFGSGGALSVEQTVELAAGLEASGQRFLWIVRLPRLEGRHPFAFGNGHGHGHEDPLAWLPEGFLERTKGRGLAVAAWAPQVRVLSHPATAAFVSHCGWNSTLESARSGVPVVALPLCADQMMNALLLEGNLGVALRPRGGGGCVVGRDEIAAALNEIMEGEKGSVVKRRARDLQKAATDAWSPEGSSSRALDEVVAKWMAALAPTDKIGPKI
ncbi:hydroquinone glucosyltransferase [Brachypodium distachyon]|uniref:Glycosyltransferase n=1 Tax=Brachypodium distachyon TaxID=15368 RepID=A0A0Q3NW04_BRADI|nr:hydroquinone glucosyltransferase [Brachypodium distachyon]KQK21694.1 hypothetical protein BRADI_1g62500v3 [Brachypodium distachyon]|eukprot:XP_014751813.1 hydroquinone glucosyltransferase [Brachypodium distachyon]